MKFILTGADILSDSFPFWLLQDFGTLVVVIYYFKSQLPLKKAQQTSVCCAFHLTHFDCSPFALLEID
ncbi:Uncharacterised protein [Enterobacter asburiae]|uniref:Uncharacterized protein n=1 Tax=Enterobacter asburiae TaxID=61645 RepID=A0A376FIU7_ENTAS|nr:Uncharacterised protein [Enterobacter asburiae]